MANSGTTELKAVAAVATRRNFRAAAAELGMSASALSHAIATLEARLGVRLFNRTTRSVSPTPACDRFLARIAPALHAIDEAFAEANEQRAMPAGLLRINLSQSAGEQILAPVVLAFLRRHPDMRVELTLDGRLIDIVAGGFDAGVRLAETVPRDMIAIPIGKTQRHIVVGAPSYFATHGKPRTPDDLKHHIGIRYRLPGGAIYRWEFERRGAPIKIDVAGPLTVDSERLVLQAAIEGAGLAYVSEWNARAALREKKLIRVLDDWTPPYPGLCFYYPRYRHVTAGMRAFCEHLRGLAAAKI